ncbi:MAG: hypothetical protein ACWA42_05755, partial [Lutibacter sp.]
PVDFNQFDDAEVKATYVSTLVYGNYSAINFLDNNNQEITFTTDFIEAPIEPSAIKYLESVEFTIKIANSFDRGFNFYFNFYDNQGLPIYTLSPVIQVQPNSEETTFTLVIPQSDIQVLNNTRFFGFVVALLPGTTLNGTETATLSLKSSAKLFYNYKKL